MTKEEKSSPLFILVAMITAVAALYFAREILLPVALAILLSFLLTPLANRLERWGVPRAAAVILVVVMSFAVLGGLGWIVTDQLVDLGKTLPTAGNKRNLLNKTEWISGTWLRVTSEISRFGKPRKGDDETSEANAKQHVQSGGAIAAQRTQLSEQTAANPQSPLAATAAKIDEAGDVLESAADKKAIPVRIVDSAVSPFELFHGWLGPIVAPFATGFIVVILTLFMLLDREGQRSRFIQLFGRTHFHATTEAVHDVAVRVGRYLRSLFLVNAGYGFAIAVGLVFLGVPSALLWGVLAFAMRFLPYLGPWIAAAIPILISIATSNGWTQPLLVFGWYVIVEIIVYNFVEPFVYGSIVGVSTVGILVAALFWTWLWGPIGLVLAMPMTVCLLVAARYVPQLRFLSVLLADEQPQSPSERVYQRLLAFDYQEPLKLAKKHLKESTLVRFYDEILIPALRMSEQDRHGDTLSEDQATFVIEAAEDLVDELGQYPVELAIAADESPAGDNAISVQESREEPIKARILCVPLLDEADEAASRMLAQLLLAEGFDVDMQSAKALTSEVVDRVADSQCDVVVISVLPPIGARDSRLLWKRLRMRYPDLPIVVGFWVGPEKKDNLPTPASDLSSKVATTLSDAIKLVHTLAVQAKVSAKTA